MKFYSISTIIFCFFLFSCQENTAQKFENNINYRQEMRDLVIDISKTAKADDPDFIVIPQNGIELLLDESSDQESIALDYFNAIDALAQEDLFFGYPEINDVTPISDNLYLNTYLHLAKTKGKGVLVIDYSSSPHLTNTSYTLNAENNFISYAAPSRELNQIPIYPVYKENSANIRTLSEAKNFLYLLNFSNYASKQDLIAELKFTNYDLIVLDLFFEDKAFTKKEIQQLKQKKNGGNRLILAYMSIGEAEDYRFYWQKHWNSSPPKWLVEENPDWEGNYKVTYWNDGWKNIIHKSEGSYLNRIINSGFDGVYLDIIDGFQYFENNY